MSNPRVLLVDDDDLVRFSFTKILDMHGFEVTAAGSVSEALKHISTSTFDVLLSDLHMPGAGDGLTVVSAMRHANPKAVTILLSAYPEMKAAVGAILLQADEILVKPMKVDALVNLIRLRLTNSDSPERVIETVAAILERSIESTIEAWFQLVQRDASLTSLPLTREERTGHLRRVMLDLVTRLRTFSPLGSREFISVAAQEHGLVRRRQGYRASMIVEESRMLQVSIFETLQHNLANIDFSVLLLQVMTIADEVDSQLAQAMESYNQEPAAA